MPENFFPAIATFAVVAIVAGTISWFLRIPPSLSSSSLVLLT